MALFVCLLKVLWADIFSLIHELWDTFMYFHAYIHLYTCRQWGILDRGGAMLYYTSFSLGRYGKGCFWTLWSKFCRSASGRSTNRDTTLIVRGPPLCHRWQEQSLAAPPTRTSQSSMKSLMLAEVKEFIPLIAHCICFGIVQMAQDVISVAIVMIHIDGSQPWQSMHYCYMYI